VCYPRLPGDSGELSGTRQHILRSCPPPPCPPPPSIPNHILSARASTRRGNTKKTLRMAQHDEETGARRPSARARDAWRAPKTLCCFATKNDLKSPLKCTVRPISLISPPPPRRELRRPHQRRAQALVRLHLAHRRYRRPRARLRWGGCVQVELSWTIALAKAQQKCFLDFASTLNLIL
jgi:hypothetical protein